MALKEPWRGNPADREYQMLTDFSGGINTKIEDSLLRDNVARNITNFDIIAGGLLSKRKGVKPFGVTQIREALKNHYKGNSILSDENDVNALLSDKKIVNSWTFIYNGNNVIVLQTEKGMINITIKWDDVQHAWIPAITEKMINASTALVQTYAEKPILLYFDKNDQGNRKPFLMSWTGENWVDYSDVKQEVGTSITSTKTVSIDDLYNGYKLAKLYITSGISFFEFVTSQPLPANSNLPKYINQIVELYPGTKSIAIGREFDVEDTGSNGELFVYWYDSERPAPSYTYKGNSWYANYSHRDSLVNVMANNPQFFANINGAAMPYVGKNTSATILSASQVNSLNSNVNVSFTTSIWAADNNVRGDLDKYGSTSTIKFDIPKKLTEQNVVIGGVNKYDFSDVNSFEIKVNSKVVINKDDFWAPSGETVPSAIEKIATNKSTMYYGQLLNSQDKIFDCLVVGYNDSNNVFRPLFAKIYETTEKFIGTGNSRAAQPLSSRILRPITSFEIKYNYTESFIDAAHSTAQKRFDAVSKFIPDAYSFQYQSYNLLSLTENQDTAIFDKTTIGDIKKLVDIDAESATPALSSIIQLNGYFPEVGKKAIYKASLDIPHDENYEDYFFGWQIMPIEKWASLEASVTSTKDILEKIIYPSFTSVGAGQGMAHSFYEVLPQTSNPSILICYAVKGAKIGTGGIIDVSGLSIEKFMQAQINISPNRVYGESFTPKEAMRDFVKVDKSIVWKNQLFLYGNSNTFFVSDINNFGYFPMTYNTQIPSDAPIRSMTIYYDSLIVATDRQQFVITGNSPMDKTSPFVINELNDDIGVVADKSVRNNANYIFQLTADGVYLVKSLFNFRDRYNTEKVDDAIAGDIIADKNACAVVWNNKYYLNIPSKNQIWIYYNDFKAWIKYESPLFNLNNMFVIDNELWMISNNAGQLYKFSDIEENVHGEGPYEDINFFDGTTEKSLTDDKGVVTKVPNTIRHEVRSVYKSKEIDFGLPNHDKKLKKLQVRFAETPGSNQLFVNVWIDGTLKVSPDKDVITTNADGTVTKTTTTTPEITTTANSNWVGTAAGEFKSGDVTYTGNRNNVGNKHDQDTDQLHEVIVAGRGRNMQFEIVHRQNKRLNVKNFATLLKVKKPKALRTYSQKG